MNYLVYVAHGADCFCDEAAYSMLSFWRRHGESLATVLVATDRPEHFDRLLGADAPVRRIRLDATQLAAWRGPAGYVHRIKPLAFAHAASQVRPEAGGVGDAFLFADSDTVFDADVAPVFAAIVRDEAVWLHASEGTIASGRRLTRSHAKLHRVARRHAFPVDGAPWTLPADMPLWNSGVIGVRGDRLPGLMRATVETLDAIRPALPIPTVEQIALSAVLARRGTRVRTLEQDVFHYYRFKEFRDDLARFFAVLAGRSRADKQVRIDAIAPALRGAPKFAFMALPKWWRQIRKHLGPVRSGWVPLPFPDLEAGPDPAPPVPRGLPVPPPRLSPPFPTFRPPMPSPDFFRRFHHLIWTLIFVGIVVATVGFAVRDAAPDAFPLLLGAGALMVAAGVVLIYVRSRMPPTPPDGSEPRPARDGGR